MYAAFISADHLSPLASTLPSMFAKSSFVWGTLLYMTTNKEIITKINRQLFMKTIKHDVCNYNLDKKMITCIIIGFLLYFFN